MSDQLCICGTRKASKVLVGYDADGKRIPLVAFCKRCWKSFGKEVVKQTEKNLPQKFPLGEVLCTDAAHATLVANGETPEALVIRHAQGDWGILVPSDAKLNERAIHNGDRIVSAYKVGGSKVLVVTEADRSVTTVLLSTEY